MSSLQGRHRDRADVQPIVQILSKPLFLHFLSQVAVARYDDGGAAGETGDAADLAEGPLLQHAEQLGLQVERHLADLIEQERAFACDLEQPGLLAVGAGECPFDMAEQFALEQVGRQGGAVDSHKRLVRMTDGVNRLGGQLFARAGLTHNEDGIASTAGHPPDHLDGLAEGLTAADHPHGGGGLVEEPSVFAGFRDLRLSSLADSNCNLPQTAVLAPSPQAVLTVREGCLLGQHDDANGSATRIVIGLLQPLTDARRRRHLIEDDQIRCHHMHNIERLRQIVRHEQFVRDGPCGVMYLRLAADDDRSSQ
jgi:hypothetical protein